MAAIGAFEQGCLKAGGCRHVTAGNGNIMGDSSLLEGLRRFRRGRVRVELEAVFELPGEEWVGADPPLRVRARDEVRFEQGGAHALDLEGVELARGRGAIDGQEWAERSEERRVGKEC